MIHFQKTTYFFLQIFGTVTAVLILLIIILSREKQDRSKNQELKKVNLL